VKKKLFNYIIKSGLLVTLALLSPIRGDCQLRPGSMPRGSGQSETVMDTIEEIYVLDSRYFTFDAFLDTIPWADTLLTSDFPYFNPLHALDHPVVDKGNIGSAAMPLTGYISNCGFDLGIQSYDYLNFSKNDFKWNINRVPFLQAFVSPSSDYNNFQIGALLSRNFDDINLGLQYRRISNTGKYRDQFAKHTNLNLGLWKGGIDEKLNIFFNLIVNVNEEKENGGVSDPETLNPRALKTNIPVALSEAVNRIQIFEFETTAYYKLSEDNSVLGFKPFVKAEMGYHTGFYKFYDRNVASDSSFYGSLWADPIGLRNFIRLNGFHSSASLYGIRSDRSNMNAGIDYARYNYTYEPNPKAGIDQIQIFARGNYYFSDNINARLDSRFYTGNYSTDYLLNSIVDYKSNVFSAFAGFEIASSSPSLMQKTLYLTSRKIYDNDFKNTLKSGVLTGISIPKAGFSVILNYDLIDNYIYFNDSKIAVQNSDRIRLMQLKIEENIKFWKIRFDNNLHVFNSSDQSIPAPSFVLRSKLYLDAKLFSDIMHLNAGFEFNYWDRYYNYGYNPAIASFYVQNDLMLDNFMRLDFFVSSHIGDVIIFARFNNILFPILANVDIKNYEYNLQYKVLNHPQDDLFWRLGFKWTFLN
jgi:hypothetical protein